MSFENKFIVVTRALCDAPSWVNAFRKANAIPILYPCIQINTETALDFINDPSFNNSSFDLTIFTSSHAVDAFYKLQKQVCINTKCLYAVGPKTAQYAETLLQRNIALVPKTFNSESLNESIKDISKKNVFLPRSNLSTSFLEESIRAKGANLFAPVLYRTAIGKGGENLKFYLKKNRVDCLSFASPSAIPFFLERIEVDQIDKELMTKMPAACLGNVTADFAKKAGFKTVLQPKCFTLENLVKVLKEYYA